ncbi:hypothetical protein [Sulfurivirga caldicuralii]|uniref:hypothetical protein n=1 Tax=Sulfurivirga caldicuralii TaxID=364032 RepID=UPI00117ECF04|nr:hypothetical protein [Sulfurivirga caldicuralii]
MSFLVMVMLPCVLATVGFLSLSHERKQKVCQKAKEKRETAETSVAAVCGHKKPACQKGDQKKQTGVETIFPKF